MRLITFGICLPLALFLSLLSSFVERRGPDYGIYCAIGKVNGIDVYCPEQKLNGGWPAPYLFDNPGISVEWKLGFFEDDFRAGPFFADAAFYLLILLALRSIAKRLFRAIRGSGESRG